MSTERFVPAVDPAAEFLEISNDFTDPKEILREAVSNAFDAHAKVLKISAWIDNSSGTEELVLQFEDDGEGIVREGLQRFFGLGYSNRRDKDKLGQKVSKSIGEKGHGTKIFFNSRRIEVISVSKGTMVKAF